MDPRYLGKIAELLTFDGVIATPAELNAVNFQDVIKDFQQRHRLVADGLPGPVTNWVLQEEFYGEPLTIEGCEADQPPGSEGFATLRLRADTAARFRELRAEINAAGGVVTTAGGLRALNAAVSAGRSATSQHYRGGAFDLALSDGLFHPERDPYVGTNPGLLRGERQRWTVFARAAGGDEMELDVIFQKAWDHTSIREVTVRGRFVNFTQIAGRHGFQPIRPRTAFVRDGKSIGAEWWHFQDEAALVPGLSQFGIELIRVAGNAYRPDRLDAIHGDLWANRRRVFQQAFGATPAWW